MDALPDTEPLLTLLALAEAGSESAAAESLGIGQSSVSRRIATLQRSSSEPLTKRTAAGSRLTPAGERLLPYAREVRTALTAAGRLLAADEAGPLSLTLGLAPELAPRFAGPLLVNAAAADLAPDLFDFELQEEGDERLLAAVRSGELPAALTTWAPAGREPGLEVARLAEDRLVLVEQPGGGLIKDGAIDAGALRLRRLLHASPESATSRRALAALGAANLEPRAALAAGSQAAVLAAVQSGAGVGVVLSSACRSEVSAGWLAAEPVPGDLATIDVWLLLGELSERDRETVNRLVNAAVASAPAP